MNKLAYSYKNYKKTKQKQYSSLVLVLNLIAGVLVALAIVGLFHLLANVYPDLWFAGTSYYSK